MSRTRLLLGLAVIAAGGGWATAQSLGSSLVYYRTPTEVVRNEVVGDRVRLGGFVEAGSVRRVGRGVTFLVSDGTTSVSVLSTGGVPSLFRAGKGVVVEGALRPDGTFGAETVLVKHDDSYRRPEPGRTPTSAELEDDG